MRRWRAQAGVLLIGLLLTALPAAAADDNWTDSDVEAADRYREQERERAERYRARLEAEPVGEAQAGATPGGESDSARGAGEGLAERIAAGLRAWLEGVLADLLRIVADALRAVAQEWFGSDEDEGETPRRQLTPNERGGIGDWLRREQGRAGDWLDGEPAAPAEPALDLREWQQREAERAREAARREAEAARERARRKPTPGPEQRWQERWSDASAWEAEERARLEAERRD